jgi:ubiquinone/menaquinone biosynthesis C-methylase UbiE
VNDTVSDQYEAFPYPEIDPETESLAALDVTPGHLLEVIQYAFAGFLDYTRPLRILSAGGGTGDASLMMAQQMTTLGLTGEVVDLDISEASHNLSRRRAEKRGIKNIRYVQGSVLDLKAGSFGSFDYINCSGMLHHLPDPIEGLSRLLSVLAPDGGIGVMVYGEYGRTGLYHLQQTLRLLDQGEDLVVKLALTRDLIDHLPPNNWLPKNPVLGGNHAELSDSEIVDRYLHSQDRAYTVPQIYDWVDSCGCSLQTFVPPGRYDARIYLIGATSAPRVAGLSQAQNAELAELLAGDMHKHTFYLRPKAAQPAALPSPMDPASIPVLRNREAAGLAAKLEPGLGFHEAHGGLQLEFPLNEMAPLIIALMNGQRTLQEIHAALEGDGNDLTWTDFLKEFGYLYEVMHRHLYRLFLTRTPMPAGRII